MNRKNVLRFGAAVLGMVAAGSASAAGIDVTEAVTTITGAITTISALGIAGLSVVVAVKTFKWAKSAL